MGNICEEMQLFKLSFLW